MEREQTVTLVLFFLLVGSLLPAAYVNIFAKETGEEPEEEPGWITYTDPSLRVVITRVENILTVEGFSSASKEEVRSALESIPGVRSVNIRSPILNPNPAINATFLHNATISLEDSVDGGYVDFKLRSMLGDIFPKFENFSGNPLVTQRGKAEALDLIHGSVPGINITRSLNGSGIELDVVLFPQTKAGDETTISASVITYNDTVIAGSGYENPRYIFPPVLTKDLLLNGTITAFSDEYLLFAKVPWENRELNGSILNGTLYDYEISGEIVANVSGFDESNLSSALGNLSGVEGFSFQDGNVSVRLLANNSGENVTAYFDGLSVSYAFLDLPLSILARDIPELRMGEIIGYLSFTHDLEVLRSANITFPERILIGNETFSFQDNLVQYQLPYNISPGVSEFNVTLQIAYDEVIGIYSLEPQKV